LAFAQAIFLPVDGKVGGALVATGVSVGEKAGRVVVIMMVSGARVAVACWAFWAEIVCATAVEIAGSFEVELPQAESKSVIVKSRVKGIHFPDPSILFPFIYRKYYTVKKERPGDRALEDIWI
jgi:hypothetical protein